MTDNNDDGIESVLIIKIYNTVNLCVDGHTLERLRAGKDTSNSASSSDDPGDGDSDSEGDQLRKDILKSFTSGPQNGANYNTVNISPDARFFRAGKGDDGNNNANKASGPALKAGKGDDGKSKSAKAVKKSRAKAGTPGRRARTI